MATFAAPPAEGEVAHHFSHDIHEKVAHETLEGDIGIGATLEEHAVFDAKYPDYFGGQKASLETKEVKDQLELSTSTITIPNDARPLLQTTIGASISAGEASSAPLSTVIVSTSSTQKQKTAAPVSHEVKRKRQAKVKTLHVQVLSAENLEVLQEEIDQKNKNKNTLIGFKVIVWIGGLEGSRKATKFQSVDFSSTDIEVEILKGNEGKDKVVKVFKKIEWTSSSASDVASSLGEHIKLLTLSAESILFVEVRLGDEDDDVNDDSKNALLSSVGLGAINIQKLRLINGEDTPIQVHLQSRRKKLRRLGTEGVAVLNLRLTAENFKKPPSDLAAPQHDDSFSRETLKLNFYEIDLGLDHSKKRPTAKRRGPWGVRTLGDVLSGTTDYTRVKAHYGDDVLFCDGATNPEQDAYNLLQTGDVILFSGHHVTCKVIQCGTSCPWSHAAMIIRNPSEKLIKRAKEVEYAKLKAKGGIQEVPQPGLLARVLAYLHLKALPVEEVKKSTGTDDDWNTPLFLLESIGDGGVRMIPLIRWFDEVSDQDVVAVRRLRRNPHLAKALIPTPEDILGIFEHGNWLSDKLARKYESDKLELIFSVFKANVSPTGHNKTYFCSELVAHCLQKVETMSRAELACNFTPKDFSDEKHSYLRDYFVRMADPDTPDKKRKKYLLEDEYLLEWNPYHFEEKVRKAEERNRD